jgi:hypothetical protein
MTHTLVGAFDSFAEANGAVEQLVQAGIARTGIQVHSRDPYNESADNEPSGIDSFTTAGDAVSADNRTSSGVRDHGGEGVMERIEHFFSNLFGGGERPAEVEHYHEAVRRGGTLLTVDVDDEAQLETVKAVLEDSGAVDIDDRLAQWQSAGYVGHDRAAPPYTADETAMERGAVPIARDEPALGNPAQRLEHFRVYPRDSGSQTGDAPIPGQERPADSGRVTGAAIDPLIDRAGSGETGVGTGAVTGAGTGVGAGVGTDEGAARGKRQPLDDESAPPTIPPAF